MGVVTWAAVKCELLPAAHEYAFAAAAELEELVDFTYRLDRVRLGDEVLIVNDAYLARLLKSAGATVDPDALPAWTLVLGLGGREHFAAGAGGGPEEGRRGARRRVRPDAAAVHPRRLDRRHRRRPRRLLRDAVEAGGRGRLRRRALRQHPRGGADLRRDRAHRRRRSRLRRRGRRRLHPAAAPGRDASRRVQPALRRLGRGHPGGHEGPRPTTWPPTSSPPARTSVGPTARGRSPSTTATPPRATPCARSRRSSTRRAS